MKASKVYLRAAEMVDARNQYSCCAIEDVLGRTLRDPWGAETERYISVFRPAAAIGGFWIYRDETCTRYEDATDKEVKQWRVLNLLFMHQIALDEEKA